MVNPQLLTYVRAQRAAGVSKEEIVKALAGGGWSAVDAQEAFAAIDGPPAPPPAPKPVTPPVTTAPATPPASTMSTMSPAMQSRPAMTPMQTPPMQPVSMRPQPAAVVQPRPVYAPAVKRRAKWPWVLLFLIIFFILGLGVGAYTAVKYEWFYSLVAGLTGITEAQQQEDMNMVANEGDEGGFLEVSPDPFDTLPEDEENSTSTPPTTSTSTSTSTSTATTTSGQ